MNSVRNTEIVVRYNNSRVKKSYLLSDRVSSVSFTDSAVGEGDNIDITVSDRDKKMISDYYPGTEDTVFCNVFLNFMEPGRTGFIGGQSYYVDQIGYSDYPSEMTLRGVSVPKNSTFSKTPQTKTWKNISLSNIVWSICGKYKLSNYFESGAFNPTIVKTEQSNATDLSFLYNLCQTYGNGMKIFSDKLIVFSEEVYENKAAVRTVSRNDIIEGSFRAQFNLIRQYTGYEYEYDGRNGVHWTKSKYFVVKPEIKIGVGQCDSDADGILKGQAKVNFANRDMQMVNFEMVGDPKMISTAVFNLSGYGALNGKYYINKVVNKFSASDGFMQEIEARKIQQRL